ncbi:sialoadhesin-like [Tachysurus vachellii]|uniref:sialoadhesin-like n=1 Tax=Tachysurus vachellii TaxID=175792 RepID=UPI00296B4613|nr:sialoadhesin-like [Tachysurus vachellii]
MLIRKMHFSLALILVFMAGVQAQQSVTFSSQSLCVVIGSTVKIPCTFTPDHSRVTERQWYRVQSSEGEPQDLRKDPEYSGRVPVNTGGSDCSLTVSNVRVSDSGVYYFRFKTQSSDWISASSGVQLTVTDLQVKVDPNTVGQSEVKVTCSSTCRLNTRRFYWYRNDHDISYTEDSIVLYSTSQYDEGSYSCKVYESTHRSPPVCVLGKQCWGVTYTPERVCALNNTSVDLSCSYKYPEGHRVIKSVWFIKEQVNVEPDNVKEDKEYKGRVQYTQSSQNDCRLRITNLRERDAQTYRFRFHTDDPTGKYTGEPGVSLSVTDLKVTVSDWYSNKKLSCITTCTLSNKPTYIWYKNRQRVTDQDRKELYVSSKEAGSFSCAVRGHEELRSPAVCVPDEKNCWSVTYSTQTICGLIGSSVDIHSYFTFPSKYKVMKMFWLIKQQANVEPEDVKEDKEYQGQVQYIQSSQNDCSLRITNLRERDAQTYRFRFHTDDPTGKYTGEPGVSLSVTDLKVTVTDSDSRQIDLSCITTCSLSNKPTYIWYKNGQRVSECKSASCSVAAVGGAVSYSCAVEGHDSLLSPPVYSPKNTTAVVLSSGDTVEGDSVTLSCSSDANPPVLTYSWFKQSSAADTLLITGQNYSISEISSQHRGLYYCTAHNQLGHHNSTPTLLDVLYSPKNTTAVVLSSGDTVEGDSVTLSCSSDANPPVLTYSWFKQSSAADTLLITAQNYSISNISSQHRGLYYCTAHNQLGHHNSTPTHLDVFYPPRNLSVTVIRSVSGDMGTLLCTSDSNPNSSYTWYRKTKEGVKLIQNGTTLPLSSREDGFHYCTARNRFGSSNSSELPYTSDSSAVKYVVSGFAIALVILVIAVILWMRFYGTYSNRRRAPAPAPTVRSEENNKNDSAPVYGNVSAMTSDPTQTPSPEDQDTVLYSSVFFQPKHTQEVPLYLTVQLPKALNQEEEVEYATVNLIKSRADRKDEIYSNLSTKTSE